MYLYIYISKNDVCTSFNPFCLFFGRSAGHGHISGEVEVVDLLGDTPARPEPGVDAAPKPPARLRRARSKMPAAALSMDQDGGSNGTEHL